MNTPMIEHDRPDQGPRDQADAAPLMLSSFVAPVGALLVLFACAYFVWSGLSTASGRFAATTTNDSSFVAAARVDLVVDGGDEVASTGLLIDAAGLYPGLRVERCFAVSYQGTVGDVPIRLFGQQGGGTGLEAFIVSSIERGVGGDNDCQDFVTRSTLFDGTLLDLWEAHGDFATGISVIDAASDGESVWVRVTVEVVDDNDAQNRTTSFWLTLEARP